MMTGSKVETERDYGASGDFPLHFERNYRSDIAYRNYYGVSSRTDFAPVGIGWSATYFQRLDTLSSGGKVTVLAYRPSGTRTEYRLIGGVFVSDADSPDHLVQLVDGSGNITGWQYITGDDTTESYDETGRLLSVASRSGALHTLSYASPSDNYPASVADPYGHQLGFTYSTTPVPKLTALTLPDGTQITYNYDSKENISTVIYPDGSTRTYLYGLTGTQDVNLLTGIMDESGTQYSAFAYSGGRATSTEHAGGVDKYTFAYSSSGSRTITDPLNTVRTYGTSLVWGARRNTSSSALCAGCGESKSTTYDGNANVSSRTDFNNNQTIYSYESGRPLEVSRTKGYGTSNARTTTTSWHATLHLPLQISEPNRTTTFTYDSSGNLLTRTITDTASGTSRTWTYTYNSYGQVLTEDGPRTGVSDVSTHTYYTCTTGYECGELHTVTDALGHVTTFNTYNAHGQPSTITDPNGVVTTLTYDARQRLTSRSVAGETTTFEYWPTGLLKKATLPDASFLLYTYDDAHRLMRLEDGEGNRIEYTLDAMGNRTAESVYDPSSTLTRTRIQVFNSLNELWKQVGAAGTTAVTTEFGYDANGNQSSIAAPLGRNTANQYDELNRLKQIADPGAGVTQFGYDANGNLTSVTDPRSNVTSYTYNGFGDLTQQVSPDTGTTVSTYDSAGNLATRTDARSKTGTYSYDALNRVTSIAYPDLITSFTYDAGTHGIGRLTGASDANHSLSFSYDAQGRVTGKSQTVGSVTESVGYGYTNGDLTSLVTPSGQTLTYGYSEGRITSITLNGSTTVLDQVLYEPFGPVSGWRWGNGTLAARVYDTDGNVTTVDSAGASDYGYDDAFRITSITDLTDSSKSWTYGYDVLDRLNSAARTGQSIGYTYDANGNRLSQTGTQTAAYTVSATSNRLDSMTGTPTRTYSYDAAGNTTADGSNTYTYTDAGRLSTVTQGGITTTYVYNALGQRVKKSNGSTTVYFMYDAAGHLIGEYDASGALIEETVWLNDTPVATLRPDGVGVSLYYVHTDHLSTPRRISRPSDNAIVWRWDSDPFGTDAANEDPDGDAASFAYNLRFPGQYYDAESGLSYNYARDYDPVTGKYLESDPIGVKGGVNTYSYVLSDPINRIDPYGLQTSDYIECILRQAGSPVRENCAQQFGNAVAKAVDDSFCDAVTCTSHCTLVNFIGKNFEQAVVNAHKEVVIKVLDKIAKETASKAAKKLLPVVGEIDFVNDAIGTVKCTTDCVKK